MLPRLWSSSAGPPGSRVEAEGILRARLGFGETEDLALFALDPPEIAAAGVDAVGRTCFVRRSLDKVRKLVLYSGQRISVDGHLLFETSGCGNVLLTSRGDLTEEELSLYNSDVVRIHVTSKAARVFVNGEVRALSY